MVVLIVLAHTRRGLMVMLVAHTMLISGWLVDNDAISDVPAI